MTSDASAPVPAVPGGFWASFFNTPLLRWAREKPLPFATLLGAVVYSVMWLGYYAFYTPLGVRLDEVGLDYGEILVQAVPFLLFGTPLLFVLVFVALVIALMVILLISKLVLWACRKDTNLLMRQLENPKCETALGLSVVLGTLFCIVAIPIWNGHRFSQRLQEGDPVQVTFSFENVPIPSVCRFQADRVQVSWLDPAREEDFGASLIYLGQNAGTTVLYDAALAQTVRVPSAAIVIRSIDQQP